MMCNGWIAELSPEVRRIARINWCIALISRLNVPRSSKDGWLWTDEGIESEVANQIHDIIVHDGLDCGCGG